MKTYKDEKTLVLQRMILFFANFKYFRILNVKVLNINMGARYSKWNEKKKKETIHTTWWRFNVFSHLKTETFNVVKNKIDFWRPCAFSYLYISFLSDLVPVPLLYIYIYIYIDLKALWSSQLQQ